MRKIHVICESNSAKSVVKKQYSQPEGLQLNSTDSPQPVAGS